MLNKKLKQFLVLGQLVISGSANRHYAVPCPCRASHRAAPTDQVWARWPISGWASQIGTTTCRARGPRATCPRLMSSVALLGCFPRRPAARVVLAEPASLGRSRSSSCRPAKLPLPLCGQLRRCAAEPPSLLLRGQPIAPPPSRVDAAPVPRPAARPHRRPAKPALLLTDGRC